MASINKNRVPSNIVEFAKRQGCLPEVKKIARWISQATGKYGISGGVAIGKYYSTLVLDITYQGAEIYLNTDTFSIKYHGQEVQTYKEFKKVYLENNK